MASQRDRSSDVTEAILAPSDRAPQSPLVSVIIPVRNDRDGIARVLSCLAAQTISRDRFEVVIGDDGSEPEEAPRTEASESWVRVVKRPPKNSYAARNAAARVARGSIFAFCDADCQPEPSWLDEAVAALADGDMVAGEVTFIAPHRPTIWSLLTADLFLDQKQNVALVRAVTANLVVKRRLFAELGGFDESMPSSGDYDFVQRGVGRGARLRYAPHAVVRHPTIDMRRPFLRKVWSTNYWSGLRRARNREKIDLRGALILVPFAGVVIARHLALRPALHLDRERLMNAAIPLAFADHVRAIATLYCVVSYVAGAARIAGWMDGRRLAKAGSGPTYCDLPVEDLQESRISAGS
jgi:glycosyltransferase involved in cell wall biosynthesis